MTTRSKLTGLIAAAHTPFKPDGSLNLVAVEAQAEHLAAHGVAGVFVGGSTGECHSLTLAERLALAERWAAVLRGGALKLVVHVGHNSVGEAAAMAAQAERLGAAAVSAMSPMYFKPADPASLLRCLAPIAAAAPRTPFYYYHIPSLTGVTVPADAVLARAARAIPTLAGVKFTSTDLAELQACLRAAGGRADVLFGIDEELIAALTLGVRGAVGSTYNFAAPIYLRLMRALDAGDLASAREEQWRAVRLIRELSAVGYMGAAKSLMERLGVPVGPARPPLGNPPPAGRRALFRRLERMGAFDWIGG